MPKKSVPAKGEIGDLDGREFDARRTGRVQTAQILKTGRTPLQVIEVAERAAGLAEDAIDSAKKTYPPPRSACKEGCDWCCYLRVGTAVPEVIRIFAYLQQTRSPEELQTLRERVLKLDAELVLATEELILELLSILTQGGGLLRVVVVLLG